MEPHVNPIDRGVAVPLAHALAAVRAHPRHLVLAALVAGLLAAPAGAVLVLPAALLALLAGGRRWPALVMGAAVLAGAGVADARRAALDAGVVAGMRGRVVASRVVVLEPVRERPIGPTVARVRLLDGEGTGEQVVLRARRSLYRGAWPSVGEIFRVAGRIEPLGRFDDYQRRRNAHAALSAFRLQRTGEARGGVAGVLDAVRRRAEAGLSGGLGPPEAALLRGMVLGDDERLTAEVRDDFQRSGLAHILAVSGQNVLLLAVLVLAACALVGVPLRARLLLAAAVIALYVPLAGGGPSIQRAGVMGVAGLVAALAGRPARRWYALLLAAAATLVLNPRAAGEPGWQLSFAAVVALLAAAVPLHGLLERRMPAAVASAAAITIAATIGTAPLMAIHFQQVSPAALPANLLAAPAIAPVMWLGVLAAAVAQVAVPLAMPFSALTAPLLVYLQEVARITGAAPGAVVEIRWSPAAIAVACAALAAAAMLALRHWHSARAAPRVDPGVVARRSRRALFAAVAAAGMVALAVLPGNRARAVPGPGELVISFLDIGQGDATLVQLGATAVLIDTGPPEGPILERLEESGVKRLDALVLTHAENDHEGAAPAVIRALSPRLVVDGGAGWPTRVQRGLAATARTSRMRIHAPAAGDVLALGGLRFEVLWPPPRDAGWRPDDDPNDDAVVSRLEAGGLSMLLTADAESEVTGALDLEPVDVLKVAHHGSADPGLPALLARVTPRIAAIEVGRGNRYGHPAPSTLAALRAAVPTVVRTDRDGTVRLHARGGRVWLEGR